MKSETLIIAKKPVIVGKLSYFRIKHWILAQPFSLQLTLNTYCETIGKKYWQKLFSYCQTCSIAGVLNSLSKF